jgi:PleD family two-component response regulator
MPILSALQHDALVERFNIGVASTGQAPGWPHGAGADAAALIGAADRALYAAKRGGRDCVMDAAALA